MSATGPSRLAVTVFCAVVAVLVVGMFVGAYLVRPGVSPYALGGGAAPAPLGAFLQQAPRAPQVFTLTCSLSDHYCPEYPARRPRPFVSQQVRVEDVHNLVQQQALANANTHLSVRMEDGQGNRIHGYALCDSPAGSRLAAALQGGPRDLALEIRHTHTSPRCVTILRVVE